MKIPVINRELDVANYEDLCHLSNLWEKENLTNAEIRNSSHIVRRLLIYGDLARSSAPRKIRLIFSAPDNKPFIKASRDGHIVFWQSGGTKVLGVWVRGGMLHKSIQTKVDSYFQEWNPEQVIDLRLESFLNQEVFGYQGNPATRHDVVTYVANKAGGPHFDSERKGAHAVLDKVRSALNFSLENGMPTIDMTVDNFSPPGDDFCPRINSIDPVFIELAATCRYMSMSTSVLALKEALKTDLGR